LSMGKNSPRRFLRLGNEAGSTGIACLEASSEASDMD
jgi:hypothetical protein